MFFTFKFQRPTRNLQKKFQLKPTLFLHERHLFCQCFLYEALRENPTKMESNNDGGHVSLYKNISSEFIY